MRKALALLLVQLGRRLDPDAGWTARGFALRDIEAGELVLDIDLLDHDQGSWLPGQDPTNPGRNTPR